MIFQSYQLFKDLVLISISFCFIACRFRGERGEEKFVRLREDAQKGSEAFRISAFPRSGFKIQALDGVSKNTFLFQVHPILYYMWKLDNFAHHFTFLCSLECPMGSFHSEN